MKSRGRILVVEDQASLAEATADALRQAGYRVDCAGSVKDSTYHNDRYPYDLAILDLGLPDGDGWDLLDGLRRAGVPVIVATSRRSLPDRLRSFEQGAVDYIAKPFFTAELVARVDARLQKDVPVVVFGAVEVDLEGRTVRVDGEARSLTPAELDLLLHLVRRPERAVSREHLADEILGGVAGRTVDAHIAHLRKKLGSDGAWIRTVWSIGYRFGRPA